MERRSGLAKLSMGILQSCSLRLSNLGICMMVIILMVLTGCEGSNSAITSSSPSTSATPMVTSSLTHAPTSTPTRLPKATSTLPPTLTETPVPTATTTPTSTFTPTPEYPIVKALMQANCRYGPGTAYLYSHGLYEGDGGELHGRNRSGSWLWIKPYNLDRHCWVAASVVEVEGDISSSPLVVSILPFTTFIGPPKNVTAVRDGNEVTVTWSPVEVSPPENSRGYLIEAFVCIDTDLVWLAVHTENAYYVFTDESGCSGASGGVLYAVEKHGYTDPLDIPWP